MSLPFQVNIDTVSGGVVQFGPALFISPKHATKTLHGSGSSNIGFQVSTFNGASSTNTLDADLLDQPILKDN
ncbi:spore germination protein [Neobacillus muris]|uniref:spore germination protein n=1 Tax=Neobacillus muris TaxID=2941334 RepID=UPI0020403688|nr:spore germination protein [Neobacillus muris]